MSPVIRYPTSINPWFGIIFFPLLAVMDILNASIQVATESTTWRSRRPDLRKRSLAMSFPNPSYEIIPHNVVCAVVVIGFMPSTFSTTDARVASILSRYSLASQRRLASTVSSSSSSSSSLESSLFPDSKLSSPSSDSTSSPSRTSVVQLSSSRTSVVQHHCHRHTSLRDNNQVWQRTRDWQ